MPEGNAHINQYFKIEENASLECFPEGTMLFRDSELKTQTHIHAHRNSVVAYCEMYASGRKNTGETFEFRSLTNRIHLYIGEYWRFGSNREWIWNGNSTHDLDIWKDTPIGEIYTFMLGTTTIII